ncbi:hypothetical protein ACHAW6_011423, partial [Cyclotella cf. meneghiniana]
MTGCDQKCRFRWADIRHPGCTSDYTAWITSQLGIDLMNPDQDVIIKDHIIGSRQKNDNSNSWITIERAFGILVHRFGILRSPMSMSINKVPTIVMCLMHVHNYYIDHCGRNEEESNMGHGVQ